MKRTHIIGIVWGAITVCLFSFGITVLFLEDDLNRNSRGYESDEEKEAYVGSNTAYITDESSIRTNELAYLENSKKENEIQSIKEINENLKTSDIHKNIKSFIRPVKGEVLNPFSTNELIYSKTLQEWRIHNGTDYKAQLGDEVYAVEDGCIKEIKFDYEYGNSLFINHDNEYESKYSNITVLDALNVGDNVKQGQLIGYVAESFGFEVAEETHLHFELKKDGKYISL